VVSEFAIVLPLADLQKRCAGADEIYGLMTALDSHANALGLCDPQTLETANRLAIALWRAGEVGQAITLLDHVLNCITSSLGCDHPTRVEILRTLARIFFEQRHLEQASEIQREILELRVRHSGANHANTLEVQGDLAAILFELGQDEEADRLEREAFEAARMYLGKNHSVTCVLAWNRVLSHERRGDPDSARKLIVSELAWLLAEDLSRLDLDQNAVRSMLAQRLNWNVAKTC
jgi:tetratricopeptide (TPR) repeat protein